MEQIIGEHCRDFRSLNLIFDLEPPLIKIDQKILFLDETVFSITVNDDEIKFEGIYQNGKSEGHWISWWSNGQKYEERNYVNGKKEGLWINWYDNGQKYEEGNYLNGDRKGLWIRWWSNGQKSSEVNYRNGKEEGLWLYWHPNGQIELEKNYRNGKLSKR